jgi:hypothetical protein
MEGVLMESGREDNGRSPEGGGGEEEAPSW